MEIALKKSNLRLIQKKINATKKLEILYIFVLSVPPKYQSKQTLTGDVTIHPQI